MPRRPGRQPTTPLDAQRRPCPRGLSTHSERVKTQSLSLYFTM